MEFICNGNINSILHGNSANSWIPFPLEKRLEIAIEVAEVLWCMHSMYSPVLHGDIKPANILLNENLTPKISDFGIARLLCANGPQQTSTVIGSIGYLDPAYCESGILTPKNDVYSFGVVLLEVITRKKAVDGTITLAQSFNEALTKGEDVQHMFDEEISVAENKKFLGDIGQLAAKCLRRDIKTRPEMVEVATSLRMIRKAMQIDQETHIGRPIWFVNIFLNKNFVPKIFNWNLSTFLGLSTVQNTVHDSGREYYSDPRDVSSQLFNLKSDVYSFGVVLLELITWKTVRHITDHGAIEIFGKVYDEQGKSFIHEAIAIAVDCLQPHIEDRPEMNVVLSRLRIIASAQSIRSKLTGMSQHDNVVQLLGYFVKEKTRVLAYEYAPRGSLYDILHGKKGVKGAQPGPLLSWLQRVKIAISAAKGLEFLRDKADPPIIHNNIKSSNILLFDNDVAKVGDIGASTHEAPNRFDKYYETVWDSRKYASGWEAPEYVMESFYTFRITLMPRLINDMPAFCVLLPSLNLLGAQSQEHIA
ncbi:uncharacterized protein [Miscanthus floridulus]|uniref:uncharacterized protein n=1 Tax=Miscanthus floridulus TaxID=154761 RepID=UPI00345936F4